MMEAMSDNKKILPKLFVEFNYIFVSALLVDMVSIISEPSPVQGGGGGDVTMFFYRNSVCLSGECHPIFVTFPSILLTPCLKISKPSSMTRGGRQNWGHVSSNLPPAAHLMLVVCEPRCFFK